MRACNYISALNITMKFIREAWRYYHLRVINFNTTGTNILRAADLLITTRINSYIFIIFSLYYTWWSLYCEIVPTL